MSKNSAISGNATTATIAATAIAEVPRLDVFEAAPAGVATTGTGVATKVGVLAVAALGRLLSYVSDAVVAFPPSVTVSESFREAPFAGADERRVTTK